jgi:hypothetical protein
MPGKLIAGRIVPHIFEVQDCSDLHPWDPVSYEDRTDARLPYGWIIT